MPQRIEAVVCNLDLIGLIRQVQTTMVCSSPHIGGARLHAWSIESGAAACNGGCVDADNCFPTCALLFLIWVSFGDAGPSKTNVNTGLSPMATCQLSRLLNDGSSLA